MLYPDQYRELFVTSRSSIENVKESVRLFIADRTARSGTGHIASSWMADLRGWNEQATNRDCKSVLSFGMLVRRSIFLAQQCICLGISDHELLLWIPRQASAQLHRVVRQNARRG